MLTDRKPEVSVIIPTFNSDRFLKGAIDSALAQSYKSIEIIVVDDGSSDRTREVVNAYGSTIRAENLPHGGVSSARNHGTRLARGNFIQYLDADDLLEPRKLEIQIEALQRTGADIAYGNWEEFSEVGIQRFESRRIVKKTMRENPEIALFTDFWCPLAVYLFRKSIVDRIKGWNERLPIIQDARFVLDGALYGAVFSYCPELMARYRIRNDSLSRQNPDAFVMDCFQNAREVEAWWLEHGGLTRDRENALLYVYQFIARNSFRRNRELFEQAYEWLRRKDQKYIPSEPWALSIASFLFGYPKAEEIAYCYRQVKKMAGFK